MSESLSRRLGGFASTLEYEKLPPYVVDKVKGLILHGLVVSIAGAPLPRVASVMEMTKREEPRPDGAALWVDGARVSRRGAAFANAKMMHATSQSDSYRMLTHPGPCVIPPAVASCEIDGGSGRDLITAVAAGYELETRIASDFIPTTQARGFRSSPVYGVFGAAVATGKVLGLDPGQMANAIALAATFSGGTGEGGRTEGQEATIHESNAAVNGITAALLAKDGVRGADLGLEGDAGFYNAFTGNNQGELSYAFEGPLSTNVDAVASGLGERYFLMDVTPKIYPTAGYNQPVIELMARLKATHEIQWDNVDRIDVEMNWLETLYPSPAFPNPRRSERRVGGTHYFAALYRCAWPLSGYQGGSGAGVCCWGVGRQQRSGTDGTCKRDRGEGTRVLLPTHDGCHERRQQLRGRDERRRDQVGSRNGFSPSAGDVRQSGDSRGPA